MYVWIYVNKGFVIQTICYGWFQKIDDEKKEKNNSGVDVAFNGIDQPEPFMLLWFFSLLRKPWNLTRQKT